MEKQFLAIGGFQNEEGAQLIDVPADMAEVVAKVKEIVAANQPGAVVSDEDMAILRAYLPAIGADEVTVNPTGGLNGNGVVSTVAEGAGIKVEASSNLDVKSVWEDFHDRKQWWGDMSVKKIDGNASTMRIDFKFRFFSVGVGTDGSNVVLHNKVYGRSFSDPFHLLDFDNGSVAATSRVDLSTFVQSCFFISAECEIRTNTGLLKI